MVAGREATPKDVEATQRLKEYWAHGAGAAKIKWGTPGDNGRIHWIVTWGTAAAGVPVFDIRSSIQNGIMELV